MSQVIAALNRDHANITKLLKIIESEILAIAVGKAPDYPMMRDIMRYMAQHSDRFHHPKEDLIIAQLLKCDSVIRADVESIIEEHVSIRLAGLEFSGLLGAPGIDSVDVREQLGACGFAYIRALREHMLKEEKQLFPLALEVLTHKEWEFIDGALDAIDDPLFDEMNADDYRRLYRLLAERTEVCA